MTKSLKPTLGSSVLPLSHESKNHQRGRNLGSTFVDKYFVYPIDLGSKNHRNAIEKYRNTGESR